MDFAEYAEPVWHEQGYAGLRPMSVQSDSARSSLDQRSSLDLRVRFAEPDGPYSGRASFDSRRPSLDASGRASTQCTKNCRCNTL